MRLPVPHQKSIEILVLPADFNQIPVQPSHHIAKVFGATFSCAISSFNQVPHSGKVLKIQASRVIAAQMRALGARPVTLAFSETRRALAAGVVDGTENPPSNFFTQKMHEVQKHVSMTNHGYLGYAVIVNKKFWDGLPADVREQLNDAMRQATAYANQIAQDENDQSMEAVKKSGKTTIYTPTAEERLALKKALVPVHNKMSSRIGKDTIQDVYQATGFDPSKL